MTNRPMKRSALAWLLPLAFALPILAVLTYALMRWGTQVQDALNIAVKLVVIP